MSNTNCPNIVFIINDQHRWDCLGCMGHQDVKTPNIDALANQGIVFENAYCPTLACGPARASLFTGLYPGSHGMDDNSYDLEPSDRTVLSELLCEAGYNTALSGKLHLHPLERRFGFEYFKRNDAPYSNYLKEEAEDSAYIDFLNNSDHFDGREGPVEIFTEDEASFFTDEKRFLLGSNPTDEYHHMTSWTAREAQNFLQNERDPNRPFFLNIGFFGPHQPCLSPEPWENMYSASDISLPDDFYSPIEDKPLFLNNSDLVSLSRKRDEKGWSEEDYKQILAAYYGSISMIDHYIGQINDKLKELGLWENTIIVFTADHGDFAGQFRSFYKGLPYDGPSHVPLIIRDPQSNINGSRLTSPVSTIDLFKTILTYAGISDYSDHESRDLTPLIEGNGNEWSNSAYYKSCDTSMLVKDNYKIIKDAGAPESVYEFYDLNDKPREKINRIHEIDYQQTIQHLKQRLDSWHDDQNLRKSNRLEMKNQKIRREK